MQLSLFGLLLLTQPLHSSEQHTRANLEFSNNFALGTGIFSQGRVLPEYMHLIGKKTYLKCAVFDITFGQIATMNSVVKSECRNMRCGETTLLAQEFFHRGVYY